MIDEPVRIVAAAVQPYRLRLARTWRWARGEMRHRRGWLLRLTDAEGIAGVGECAPLPEAGTETRDVAETGLADLQDRVPGRRLADVWESLESEALPPAVRCAVETAVLDLVARRRGLPVARLLNPAAGSRVAVNANIGAADGDLPGRAQAALQRGYRVLKVKLGVYPLEAELRHLRAAAAVLPGGIGMRLDANGAWDEPTAVRALEALTGLPVESLEEPLAAADPDVLARLQEGAAFPLALDESLAATVARGMTNGLPVQRVVIKPMVAGGARPALRLASLAGGSAVITTTVDAAPGRWMAAHLAAALDNGLCHGLATGDWLAEDLGAGPTVCDGECRVFG